jgi:hypothetical protein
MVFLSDARASTIVETVGTFAGAVYNPACVMVPMVEFPPTTPFTSHVTAVFMRPVTVAVYWTVWFTPTFMYPGLIATFTV